MSLRVMRVKNRKTGLYVDLPDDDGMISVVRWAWVDRAGGPMVPRHVLLNQDQVRLRTLRLQAAMSTHDSRPRRERWGGNQWGEGWVGRREDRRHELEAREPLLRTDLTLLQWHQVAA